MMGARVMPVALVSLLGCGADEVGGEAGTLDVVGSVEQSLAVCDGDDSNAVAAALAVAVANELGRWDALSDFQLVHGRLQLSPRGERRCESWRSGSSGGCENVRAVLDLQLDATAVVPGHDPASLRGKLSAWYQSQQALAASRLPKHGKAVEVPSRATGALSARGPSALATSQLSLSPIAAGAPHVLTFSNVTGDGPCGDYYWYDITQPDGQPLPEPANAHELLIFAGGRASPTGTEPNPFISQKGSARVAIDPAYGLNAMPETSPVACSPACIQFSLQSISGQCCTCNGAAQTYKRSAWSGTTYVCQ
jgi:hypothetical protein